MVINLIVPDREMSEAENRKLAEKPQLSMNNAAGGDFMEQYENYAADQFAARDICAASGYP